MSSSSAPALPSVGILMINHNQWGFTRKCVKSLFDSRGVKVIIGLVDNCSREKPPDWVFNEERICFHQSDSNDGFIAGNIKAFEMVAERDVDFVMLLNNDTEVEPDTLALLVEQFSKEADSGLVTPAITYAENNKLIWHAGGRFIPWKMGVKQLYATTSQLPREPVEVDLVSGCAMMMRTGHFREIGYQDENFFIYHEDAEQSIRTRKMGYRNYLVPGARVVHHVSITVGGVLSPFAVYFTHRNRFIFARRNLGFLNMTLFSFYYFAVTMMKTIVYPVRGSGKLVPWMWLAVIHGVTGQRAKRPKALFR